MTRAGPVRIGLVGCGAFARFALGAVAESPLVSLVAVADPREECRLEALRVWQRSSEPPGSPGPHAAPHAGPRAGPRAGPHAGPYAGPHAGPHSRPGAPTEVRVYQDGAEVCRDPDVDLVWILAPPYLHYSLARAALERGKAVFLEKPGALRPAEMEELAALADRLGIPASVDFVLRRTPLARLVARLLTKGVLGPVERAVLENVAHDEQLPEGHWFWNPVLSGGIFVEHGVHFFDMANWWFGTGEARHAVALRRTRWKDAPVDRVLCTCLHGSPPSPVLATYYHSFTTVQRFERAHWHLVLHRGFLDIEGWIPVALRGEVLVSDAEARWLEQCLGCPLQPLDPPQPDRDPAWAEEGHATGQPTVEESGTEGPREDSRAGGARQDSGAGTTCEGFVVGTTREDSGSAMPREAAGAGATREGMGVLRYRARLVVECPDRAATYRSAIRAGLEDLAACLREPGRRPAVTLNDAHRALQLASQATELAVLGGEQNPQR